MIVPLWLNSSKLFHELLAERTKAAEEELAPPESPKLDPTEAAGKFYGAAFQSGRRVDHTLTPGSILPLCRPSKVQG